MNIKFNNQNDSYIYNLAFIRALLIKSSIENMSITNEEKEKVFTLVLDYLKNN